MENGDDAMARDPGSAGRKPSRGNGSPRLFIKEMVMRNFKSYAGEQRVGPFHKVRVLSSFTVGFAGFVAKKQEFRPRACW